MRKLITTLSDYDPDLLAIIANRWDVDIDDHDKRAAAETLAEHMLDPAAAAAEWARLTDEERGALQTLLGSPDHKMAEGHFSRIFGEIRQMGPGRREREKPHLNPISAAEALYFRGLIAVGFDQGKAGGQRSVYVPGDLAAVLPIHETGLALNLEDRPREVFQGEQPVTPEAVLPATTALVDDMTTLLALLQIKDVPADRDTLLEQVEDALQPYWLGEVYPARTALLLSLAGSLGLAATENGVFKPIPSSVRAWLDDTRPRQVRTLAEAWRTTTAYNDLWHTPGLIPEDTGWNNDPLLARQTVLTSLETVPGEEWWPVNSLIQMVKDEDPDFQRPGADYESWYIRDADSGDYLSGFESWDRVDGGVLWFILTGPMHWLGLLDLGDEGRYGRLTAYGRALIGQAEWPDPAEDRTPLAVEADGTVRVPRTLSRYERFQLARITEWRSAGDPYIYAITAGGFHRAAQQDIPADAMIAFLRRSSGGELPASVLKLIHQWEQAGSAQARLTPTVVLQTDTPETLDTILKTPELRRYLGGTLGPRAVMVRAGQERALAQALQQHGIMAELDD